TGDGPLSPPRLGVGRWRASWLVEHDLRSEAARPDDRATGRRAATTAEGCRTYPNKVTTREAIASASAPTPVTSAEPWLVCHGRPTWNRFETGDTPRDSMK